MENRMIYVVFSATPLKIGSMIRVITRGEYNHVALSFEKDLSKLYSYARYHKKTPFYGGFVEESAARYRHKNKVAKIYVCAIPLPGKVYDKIKERIDDMLASPKKYKYNMFSAAAVPISKRVHIDGCYTCIEFVVSILSMALSDISKNEFYTIESLKKRLSKYLIYKGPFPNSSPDIDEVYEKKIPLHRAAYLSARMQARLLSDYISRNKK